jgi:hypothetical protein
MATLKELNEHYKIYGKYDDEYPYLVYDKREGSSKRSVRKYLCCLKKKNNRFAIVGTEKYFSKIEDIKKAINNYVKSLEFDSEYYNPSYRKGYFEEMVIVDFLYERGFKSSHGFGGNSMNFELTEKNIYGGNTDKISITIRGLNCMGDNIPEMVNIILWTGNYSWIEDSAIREPKEIIKKLNSILKPLFLTEGVRNVNHSENYSIEQFNATLNELDSTGFNKYTKEYKEELKSKLTTILEKL